ncbi:MAG TPA: PAS domain-containing protein [Candidatus Binataceae bacterium]|nr:PAS domain-containing protein [Candidatus Binataceae bacterium]
MADESAADKRNLLLIGIGASPNAIEALKDLLSLVETDRASACAIAIPVWAGQDSKLSRLLRANPPLPITQPQDIERVDAEGIYLFSPDKYLVAINDVLKMLGADSVRIDKIVAGGGGAPELEHELQRIREQLRTAEERNQTASQELRLVSEEMRSAIEALETGKQSLEAINRELVTLSQEYKEKIDEAARARSDLQSLLGVAESAAIFLDRALSLYLYTSRAQQILNIAPADIGRSFARFANRLNYNDLEADAAKVMRSRTPIERELQTLDGDRYRASLRAYCTPDEKIEGVMLRLARL